MRVRTHQHKKTSLVEYCLVHHNIFCVTRSPFAFRDIITPCLRSGISRISLSTPHSVRGYHRSLAFGDIADIAQHTTFQKSPLRGSRSIPVCKRGSHVMQSPYAYGDYIMRSLYAYGDQEQSPYAYRDNENPRMHMGVKINPRMHTGIACQVIPVCIRGFAHPCMHTGIGWTLIPVCIRGF